MDTTMKTAMERTADPRIYASAAKQSIQPSRYVMSDVKYTYSEKINSVKFETLDKPEVRVPKFNKDELAFCSWVDK